MTKDPDPYGSRTRKPKNIRNLRDPDSQQWNKVRISTNRSSPKLSSYYIYKEDPFPLSCEDNGSPYRRAKNIRIQISNTGTISTECIPFWSSYRGILVLR